jgi:hypothetical protein
MKVYISGGNHITNPSERIEEVEEALDEIDVVFAESPFSDDVDITTKLKNWLGVPLLLLPMYTWTGILSRAEGLTQHTDADVITRISDTHSAEVVRIDVNPHIVINEEFDVWLISHWCTALLALFSVYTIYSLQYDSLILSVATMFTFAGIGLFAGYLAGTNRGRNISMASDIQQYAEIHPDENACVVVGGKHSKGISNHLKDSNSVEIVA